MVENKDPPAGFGVELEFFGFNFENPKLDALKQSNKVKYAQGQDIFKGKPLAIYKRQDSDAEDADAEDGVLIPQSANALWSLTAEHAAATATYATCKGEIIIDGLKVAVNGKDNFQIVQVADEINKFMAALGSDVNLLYAKISQEVEDKYPSIFKDIGHWDIKTLPATNPNVTVHVTTAMPIEGLLALPDCLVAFNRDSLGVGVRFANKQVSTRYPKSNANDGNDDDKRNPNIFEMTQERWLAANSPLWRGSDAQELPADFCAFLILLSLFVSKSERTTQAQGNGPKEVTAILPRNDFVTLFQHVRGKEVMRQYFRSPFSFSLCTLVGWVIGSDTWLSSYAFKWKNEVKEVERVKTEKPFMPTENQTPEDYELTAKDWTDGIQAGEDKLKQFDADYGDASIGRLGAKMEAISGDGTSSAKSSHPIWEFRNMSLTLDQLEKRLIELNDRFSKLAEWEPPKVLETAKVKEMYENREKAIRAWYIQTAAKAAATR